LLYVLAIWSLAAAFLRFPQPFMLQDRFDDLRLFYDADNFHGDPAFWSGEWIDFMDFSVLFSPKSAATQSTMPAANESAMPAGRFMTSMLSNNIHTLRNTGMEPSNRTVSQKARFHLQNCMSVASFRQGYGVCD
jgi:hypothetical protein